MIYLNIFILFIFSFNILLAQWIQQSPPITSNNLTSITFVKNKGCIISPTELFLYSSTDSIWNNKKNSSTYESFYSAAYTDKNNCILIASELEEESFIYVSSDGGNIWENMRFGLPYRFKDVIFHGTIGWISGEYLFPPPYYRIILKTINGGETWEQLNGFDEIYFLNENVGFATDGLRIYKTTNGGNSWTVKYSPPAGNGLYGINFSDDVTGWAYGGSSELLKTYDAGENWIEISTNIQHAILCSFFLDNNTGWMGGYLGVYKTTDGGNNWIDVSPPIGYLYWVSNIYFKNYNEGFLCTTSNKVYKTTDGGNNWIEENSVQAREIYFVDSQVGYAGGNGNIIFKTTNGGTTWIQQLTQNYRFSDILGIDFVSANDGWAVGNNGTIYHTINGGEDWKIQQSYKLPNLQSISAIDSNHIWICGNNGVILKVSLGDKIIKHQFSRLSDRLNQIFFFDENNGWAISTDDVILKTTNGGINWTKNSYTSQGSQKSIYFIDSTTGWLLTNYSFFPYIKDSHIIKTNDGGNNWQLISTINGTYNKVLFVNQTKGFLVGEQGSILKTIDAGINWSTDSSGITETLNDIALGEHIYIVGNNGVLLQSEKTFSIDSSEVTTPVNFILNQNYPNPFNSSSIISYQLPVSSEVTLKVYDVLGNEVVTLIDEYKPAGNYEIEFHSKVNSRRLVSGVYFYKLSAGSYVETKKMILLR